MKTITQRFWSKVKKINECLEWQGWCYKTGYGRFSHSPKKHESAHRLSYKISKGEIPEGLFVLHACDNKKCVNPNHLFIGNQFDNMKDASSKGRLNVKHKRIKPTNFKIDKTKANEIRIMYGKGNISQFSIGKIFGLTQTQISNIIRFKDWK